MIYIAINVVFNAFVLALVLLLGVDIIHHMPPIVAWCVSYAVVGVLALLGYTRLGNSIVSIFLPGRAMIGREKAKLEPLLSDVIENVNHEYGTHYKLSDFKIKVTDDKVVNAFAVGYNTITVNRGAFDAFSDEQLRAILAHEVAHLYYRDSVRSIALIFSSFGTRVIMWIYAIYSIVAQALAGIGSKSRNEGMQVAGIFALIPLLMFLPVVVLNWIGAKVFTLLNMKMSRGAEYRADAFVASLGYKSDMIGALEVLDGITVYDNSFFGKLLATHPANMQRIGALEDEELAKKKIGNLFVASPFSKSNDIHITGNKEVIRLAAVLIVAGIVWCIWGGWEHIKPLFFE